MPYRRLPNTDQARLRALKAVVAKGDTYNISTLAVNLKSLSEARNFLTRFEAAQIYYSQCYNRQAEAGKKHVGKSKMARLYVSHFIQVLNLAAIRGEVRPEHKDFYGLERDGNTLPDLSSESSLAEWGRRVIDGEQARLSRGGIPIYNPTIAKVRVHYDLFMEGYEKQKELQAATARSLEALSAMRARADELILDLWNQIEKKYEAVTPNEQRLNACREYGVIYYYRKGENKE